MSAGTITSFDNENMSGSMPHAVVNPMRQSCISPITQVIDGYPETVRSGGNLVPVRKPPLAVMLRAFMEAQGATVVKSLLQSLTKVAMPKSLLPDPLVIPEIICGHATKPISDILWRLEAMRASIATGARHFDIHAMRLFVETFQAPDLYWMFNPCRTNYRLGHQEVPYHSSIMIKAINSGVAADKYDKDLNHFRIGCMVSPAAQGGMVGPCVAHMVHHTTSTMVWPKDLNECIPDLELMLTLKGPDYVVFVQWMAMYNADSKQCRPGAVRGNYLYDPNALNFPSHAGRDLGFEFESAKGNPEFSDAVDLFGEHRANITAYAYMCEISPGFCDVVTLFHEGVLYCDKDAAFSHAIKNITKSVQYSVAKDWVPSARQAKFEADELERMHRVVSERVNQVAFNRSVARFPLVDE